MFTDYEETGAKKETSSSDTSDVMTTLNMISAIMLFVPLAK